MPNFDNAVEYDAASAVSKEIHSMTAPKSVCRTTIHHLPIEILNYLFDEFLQLKGLRTRTMILEGDRMGDDRDCIKTVQSLRQVCRLFHDLVSPLLCQRLDISISQTSLDRAYGLLKNSSVASGIRGVQIVLGYRPAELVSDLSLFAQKRLRKLRELSDNIDWMMEGEVLAAEERYGNNSASRGKENPYGLHMDNFKKIRASWQHYMENRRGNHRAIENEEQFPSSEDNNDEEWEESDEYGTILIESHELFRKHHEVQLDLIESRSFVNSVARIICQLPHPVSLGFIDRLRTTEIPMSTLTSKEDLSSFLSSPFDWCEIEEILTEGQPLLPAGILSDLPITIHKLGGILRHIKIGCIPARGSYSLIQPKLAIPSHCSPWAQLREACQSLEVLEMDGPQFSHLPMRMEHISPTDRTYLESFFGALVSSPNLHILNLRFYALALNPRRSSEREWCPLGAIFDAANWPHIRELSVVSISVTEEQLENLCKAIGHEIEHLHLAAFRLHGGSWLNAIDILRDKVGSRCAQGKTKLFFSNMKGGEFRSEEQPEDRLVGFRYSRFGGRGREEPDSLKLARQYIKGEIDENPLRTR